MEVKQFFCPSAFDLSFWGSSDDIVKKSLFVDFKIQKNDYLEGKHILMLINTQEPVFEDNYEKVQLKHYTDMMWLPINSRSPMSETVTFSKKQFWKKGTEFDQYKYKVDDVESFSWISVDKTVQSAPYSYPIT